jgi:uracil-DNA glycosylase
VTDQRIVHAYAQYQELEQLAHLRASSPFVGGDGPLNSPLLIVGEAPGPEEIRALRPFVGPSGQHLDRNILAPAGIQRRLCRVTNTVKYMPLGTDGYNFRQPYYGEISASVPCLLVEIAMTHPAWILAMGATALKALAPGKMLSEVHGRPQLVHLGADRLRVLPLYHPSYCLREPEGTAANCQALMQLGMGES